MFDFNWGVFWSTLCAVLAAFAVRGAVRMWVAFNTNFVPMGESPEEKLVERVISVEKELRKISGELESVGRDVSKIEIHLTSGGS